MTQAHQGTALITGASTGIGAVYAERLAQRGYDLILVARRRDRLASLAERITNATQRSVEIIDADLNDRTSLAAVEAKLREDASITLLVNNAGIGTHTPLLDSDVDAMTRMIDLNVTALTRLTYAAVPGFVSRGKGAIINIASIVGIAPEILNGVYGGTKAFVLAFSRSLHHELASKGVKVQAVLPGATATDFWETGGLPLEQPRPGHRHARRRHGRCGAQRFRTGRTRHDSVPARRREVGRVRGCPPGDDAGTVDQHGRKPLHRCLKSHSDRIDARYAGGADNHRRRPSRAFIFKETSACLSF